MQVNLTKIDFFKNAIFATLLILCSCSLSNVESPATISGKIIDSRGIVITEVTASFRSPSFESVSNSTDGNFKFTLTSGGGPIEIIFSKVGYTQKIYRSVLLGGDNKIVDITLQTTP